MSTLNARHALFAALVAFLPVAVVQADSIYLTGALSYSSDSTGKNNGGAAEYDTFSAPYITHNSGMSIGTLSQGGATSILLPLGSSTFSTSTGFGPTVGLGLYFSSTATRTFAFNAAPDLVAVDLLGPGWTTPANGISVSTYGQFSAETLYAGNTSFTLGDKKVRVTDFSGGASGSITFEVTDLAAAAPLPSPFGMGILTFATLGGLALIKRKGLSRGVGNAALKATAL